MPLRELDAPIGTLSLILHLGKTGGSYGDALHEAGFRKPRIYVTLDALLDMKIIRDAYEPSDKGGGVRRMYRLTPLGMEIFKHLSAIDELLR